VRNERLATRAPSAFAPLVGTPVVHAAHAGRLRCAMPWSPIAYDGHFEGGASITAADGRVLAFRSWREGAGVVAADVEPRRVTPRAQLPERFWLHRRGALGAFVWNYQRAHGRRWYQRNVYAPPAMAGRMTSTSLSPTSVSRP